MNPQDLLGPACWAQKTFGPAKLKDIRRTGRAVKVARRLAWTKH
ncbi:transposase [Ktedonospora formicarum]